MIVELPSNLLRVEVKQATGRNGPYKGQLFEKRLVSHQPPGSDPVKGAEAVSTEMFR
jgi:hypothetical protein